MSQVRVLVTQDPLDEGRVRQAVSKASNGAVLVFSGIVRDHHEGKAVTHIDYQSYDVMARTELARIVDEVEARHDIDGLVVHHRTGPVHVGEASLLVGVGAAHRRPAFEAGLELIDELKRRVPIWKKEFGPDGSHWVEGIRPATGGEDAP